MIKIYCYKIIIIKKIKPILVTVEGIVTDAKRVGLLVISNILLPINLSPLTKEIKVREVQNWNASAPLSI